MAAGSNSLPSCSNEVPGVVTGLALGDDTWNARKLVQILVQDPIIKCPIILCKTEDEVLCWLVNGLASLRPGPQLVRELQVSTLDLRKMFLFPASWSHAKDV